MIIVPPGVEVDVGELLPHEYSGGTADVPLHWQGEPLRPQIEIQRVQDYRRLPQPNQRFLSLPLVPAFEVPPFLVDGWAPLVESRNRADGVEFDLPGRERFFDRTVSSPLRVRVRVPERSGAGRYAYRWRGGGSYADPYRLEILATNDVDVSMEMSRATAGDGRVQVYSYVASRVPLQGEAWPEGELISRPVRFLLRAPQDPNEVLRDVAPVIVQATAEMGVGLLSSRVSDVLDVAQALLATATGRDILGNPLAVWEIAAMWGAVLAGVVPSSIARLPGRVLQAARQLHSMDDLAALRTATRELLPGLDAEAGRIARRAREGGSAAVQGQLYELGERALRAGEAPARRAIRATDRLAAPGPIGRVRSAARAAAASGPSIPSPLRRLAASEGALPSSLGTSEDLLELPFQVPADPMRPADDLDDMLRFDPQSVETITEDMLRAWRRRDLQLAGRTRELLDQTVSGILDAHGIIDLARRVRVRDAIREAVLDTGGAADQAEAVAGALRRALAEDEGGLLARVDELAEQGAGLARERGVSFRRADWLHDADEEAALRIARYRDETPQEVALAALNAYADGWRLRRWAVIQGELHRRAVRRAVQARRLEARRRFGRWRRELSLREQFREAMIDRILEHPHHPLLSILDAERGNFAPSISGRHADLMERPTVDAGHVVSRFSGAPERFALEDAWANRDAGVHIEAIGHVVSREVIDVAGVPVEAVTARVWESNGLLPAGFVERARRIEGWNPAGYTTPLLRLAEEAEQVDVALRVAGEVERVLDQIGANRASDAVRSAEAQALLDAQRTRLSASDVSLLEQMLHSSGRRRTAVPDPDLPHQPVSGTDPQWDRVMDALQESTGTRVDVDDETGRTRSR
ncbi:MAG: hypothetical protein IPG45_16325 [Deltaproteobacteria bacterium]|nr:hypothetical protein [Deltaproteobacteria bacterium]